MAEFNPSLRQWLGSMEPWQWAQCFDEGYRYGQMTTSLVEVINSVLRRMRHLPISTVFSATFYRLATLMPKMGLKQATQTIFPKFGNFSSDRVYWSPVGDPATVLRS
ncbi:hypothetical protein GOBAR_DD27766 [Gossypium barbadense]|nr:hypothetical protein GOBAR_DD27766 [Gossypium barbadense]